MKRNESRGGRERGYPPSQPFDVFFKTKQLKWCNFGHPQSGFKRDKA